MTARKTNEPVEELTLESLKKKLDVLEAELAISKEELKEKDEEIRALKAQDEGWLITTPEPDYDGKLFGVSFTNGLAFVPKKRVFPDFEPKPMTALEEHKIRTEMFKGMPKELAEKYIANTREREKLLSSELAMEQFEKDFGYKVEWFGMDDLDKIELRVQERRMQRVEKEDMLSRNTVENILTPSMMSR